MFWVEINEHLGGGKEFHSQHNRIGKKTTRMYKDRNPLYTACMLLLFLRKSTFDFFIYYLAQFSASTSDICTRVRSDVNRECD